MCRSSASDVAVTMAAPTAWTHPEGDQAAHAPGERAAQRTQAEDDEPGEEDPPPADAVGDPARRRQQRGEGDRVAVEHPRQRAGRGVQRPAQLRERDVDDEQVEAGEEHRRGDHEEHEAGSGGARGPWLRRRHAPPPRSWFGCRTDWAGPYTSGFDMRTLWHDDTAGRPTGAALLHRGRPRRRRRPLGAARRPGGVARRAPVQRDPARHRRTPRAAGRPAERPGRRRRARAPRVQPEPAALRLPPDPFRTRPAAGAPGPHAVGRPARRRRPARRAAPPRPPDPGVLGVRRLRRADRPGRAERPPTEPGHGPA